MTRIFSALAAFSLLLLAANLLLGFWIGDYNRQAARIFETRRELTRLEREYAASDARVQAARRQMNEVFADAEPASYRTMLHRMLGVLATLVAVLVNSITVTYFIGTSRWCREVVETYHLPVELAGQSSALKRRSFPWALGSILVVLAVAVLGAAADPATGRSGTEAWVTPHSLVALLGTAFMGWSFYAQAVSIGDNYRVIEKILEQVQQVRARAERPVSNI